MKSGPVRPLAENSFLDSRSFSGAGATGCVCGGGGGEGSGCPGQALINGSSGRQHPLSPVPGEPAGLGRGPGIYL